MDLLTCNPDIILDDSIPDDKDKYTVSVQLSFVKGRFVKTRLKTFIYTFSYIDE